MTAHKLLLSCAASALVRGDLTAAVDALTLLGEASEQHGHELATLDRETFGVVLEALREATEMLL